MPRSRSGSGIPPSQSRTLDCQTNGANGWQRRDAVRCPPTRSTIRLGTHQVASRLRRRASVSTRPIASPQRTATSSRTIATDLWASPCSDTPNNWYTQTHNGHEPAPEDPNAGSRCSSWTRRLYGLTGKEVLPDSQIRRLLCHCREAGINCQDDDPNPLPPSTKSTHLRPLRDLHPPDRRRDHSWAPSCARSPKPGVCVPVPSRIASGGRAVRPE